MTPVVLNNDGTFKVIKPVGFQPNEIEGENGQEEAV